MSCSGFVIELLHYRRVPNEAGRTKATQLGYAHLSFVVDSVSERMNLAAQWGGSAAVGSRTEVRFGVGAPAVIGFVSDPSGNPIELIEHPDGSAASDHARFLNAASLGWPPKA
jgi:catechol 2,3-dioxygenase-like lactoylglutathione lyase family enzyme